MFESRALTGGRLSLHLYLGCVHSAAFRWQVGVPEGLPPILGGQHEVEAARQTDGAAPLPGGLAAVKLT